MRKKNVATIYFLMVGILLLSGCNKGKERETVTNVPTSTPVVSLMPTKDKLVSSKDINTLVSSLTLEEKAAQITGSLETLLPEENAYNYKEEMIEPNVVFPNNMALGVVNDANAMYQIGLYIGNEDRKAGAKISFARVSTVSTNPIWSGTYLSFSEEYERVYQLGEAYVKGLAASGIMPCLCDFIGTGYGEDEASVSLSEEEIRKQLYIYRRLLDAVQEEDKSLPVAIKVSSVTINGTKMIENKELLTDMLKGVMKFDGIVMGQASDIYGIEKDSLKEKVAAAINAGVDSIYAPDTPTEYKKAILAAVEGKLLSEDRVDEAVTRILTVKSKLGLFEDNVKTEFNKSAMKQEEAEELAASLVEKSLVLLQNKNEVLPLKKSLSIYVTGPAAEDLLLQGLKEVAKDYEYDIITDKTKANKADVTLLCLGETIDVEKVKDESPLSVTAHPGNTEAITEAKDLGLPTVTLLLSGRQQNISAYKDQWDAIVMCYLPGSREDRIAHVLAGEIEFAGKLALSWYGSEEEFTPEHILYGKGYGREY